MNLYYRIWVDAIVTEKAKRSDGDSWKLFTLIPMSLLQGINLFTFLYWMKTLFNKDLPLFIPVFIFNFKALNSFIGIMLSLFIPFLILNYLLIFNNNRYERLINVYQSKDGTLYKRYMYISLAVLAIPVLITILF